MQALDWQWVIVALAVAAAAGVLIRRTWKWAVEATRPGGSCGGCHGCSSDSPGGLVDLQVSPSQKK